MMPTDPALPRRNVELKARIESLEHARLVAEKIGARFVEVLRQKDTYFVAAHGRLKLREINGTQSELIWYDRSNDVSSRTSRYQLLPIENPRTLAALLGPAMGVRQVVEKCRELWLFENVRIHLDEVEQLGTFLEFEAVLGVHDKEADGHAVISQLKQEFQIADTDLVLTSYGDLLDA